MLDLDEAAWLRPVGAVFSLLSRTLDGGCGCRFELGGCGMCAPDTAAGTAEAFVCVYVRAEKPPVRARANGR